MRRRAHSKLPVTIHEGMLGKGFATSYTRKWKVAGISCHSEASAQWQKQQCFNTLFWTLMNIIICLRCKARTQQESAIARLVARLDLAQRERIFILLQL